MKQLMFTLLAVFAVIITSAPAAVISFSEPVSAMSTSVLDVELDNPNYTFVEGVTYGSGAKTFTTAGGNTITLAGNNANLGSVDMPAATPSVTSGWYNGNAQWNNSLLAGSTDVVEWTDALKGNLWHNDISDATRPLTLHLAGLTIGQKYAVQLYSADARYTDREQAYAGSFSGGVFNNTSVSFSQNPAYKVTGTFIADAAYQDIFVQATDGIGNSDTTIAVYTLYAVSGKVIESAPSNGAVNVALTQDLNWTVLDPNVKYVDLYFSTESDPNLYLPANLKLSHVPATTTTWDTGTMAYSTTYYWSVDAYEPNTLPGGTGENFTPGSIFRFTTIAQQASVTPVSPARTTVDAGTASVVLSVTGTNADTYQWYKVGTPDAALSDGADYTGTATNTLTIYDIQLADEGNYYCQVDNAETDPVNSVPGLVMTKRLMTHFPLETIEGGVSPDVVSGYQMTLLNAVTGRPLGTSGAGVDELGGSSLSLNNTNAADPNFWGQYAVIEQGVVDYEDITIAFWVHWNGGSNWQRIIDFGNSTNQYMFLTPGNGSQCRFVMKNGGGEQVIATSPLPTGQWIYLTVTLNGNTGRLYVNGELQATNTGMTINPNDFNPALNYIGKSQYPADPYFNGRIDDLRISNYARTTEQVALDYLAVKGDWVCNNEGTANITYDLNDDCQVDLGDLALLAADWLNSNRIYAP